MKIQLSSSELVPSMRLISKLTSIDVSKYIIDVGTASFVGNLVIKDTIPATPSTPAFAVTLELEFSE